MLREICFQLDKGTVDALNGKMESVLADLAAHGIRVSGLRGCEKCIVDAHEKRCGDSIAGADQEKTIYIADQEQVYTALKEKGCYVLPYLHENNRGESFPGALYAVEKLEEMNEESFDLAYRRLAGLPWNILATGRCAVRETTVEDVDSFYRIYAEPSITEYMENLFADRDEEIAYTKDYIEKVYAFYGYGMWTVLEKESGEVIGRAGITWREGYDLPELGFVFGVPWQGRGYAYEVCGAILAYARDELLMERVQALVRPGNERSLRLCERLGFVLAGETVLDRERHVLLVKEL